LVPEVIALKGSKVSRDTVDRLGAIFQELARLIVAFGFDCKHSWCIDYSYCIIEGDPDVASHTINQDIISNHGIYCFCYTIVLYM